MNRALALILLAGTWLHPAAVVAEEASPYCAPGQPAAFVLGFAQLSARLGSVMGTPLECEHRDPRTGDVRQQTTTGFVLYPAAGGSPSFHSGSRHWALDGTETLTWDGTALEFPDSDARPDPRLAAALTMRPLKATTFPLNGRFLLANMHGALFHTAATDFPANVSYARWLGAGVIRVFATDSNTFKPLSGRQIGERIAQFAPDLRAGGVRLIVAFVNNHQPVPGENPASSGWMDGYYQLLLPFYAGTWRQAYLPFVHDVISTVRERGALDVIQAWELGNELHTPQDPPSIMRFLYAATREVRALDPVTPILPGTMGVNHLQPWSTHSQIARWVYCEADVDAYTLHAYDWVSRQRQGDMPIEWDLDNITAEPCPSGRQLPVIVEELGTSRALSGLYGPDDGLARLEQERNQIRFVLGYPRVAGLGVWSAESPRILDRNYSDNRRGLTSYGPDGKGGGSCYDPAPLDRPGDRCALEQILRRLPEMPG